MADKCPICYRELSTWTHDPILLPNGSKYKWISDNELVLESDIEQRLYKGILQIREDDIIELQEQLILLESEYGVTPITEFSPVNNSGKFQITGKHIKEMRDSIEKILAEIGWSKIDYFNYDEDNNHITHPDGDKLDWTDPIIESTELQKFQIKYIHIEDLRHKIGELWENFQEGGSSSISVVGISDPGISDTFELQKNQYWYGSVFADYEFTNHGIYWNSNSSANMSINTSGVGSAIANAIAHGGSLGFHVGVSVFPAFALSNSGILAFIPVVGGITDYPVTKTIYNPITKVNDTYHLHVKAKCSPIVSVSGSYSTGDIQNVFLATGSKTTPPTEVTEWNNEPVVPNTSATASAKIILNIPIMFFGGGGISLTLVHGVYYNESPVGTAKDLTDFDIDIAQEEIDLIGYAAGYVTQFNITANAGGTANSLDIKAGDAIWVDDPLQPDPDFVIWYGPFRPSGGEGRASASFDIDNINFYYKKV